MYVICNKDKRKPLSCFDFLKIHYFHSKDDAMFCATALETSLNKEKKYKSI